MKIKKIEKVVLEEPKQFYDIIECAPNHNFGIKTNSGIIFSHNCNLTDEVDFNAMTTNVEKMKTKMKHLIAQIDARMKSRFLRGNYLPTLNIIISSKSSSQSFLATYIEMKKKNESKTTLIIDEPQWVVDSRKVTGQWFKVAIGNKFLANEVLPLNAPKDLVDEYRARGYSLIDVPSGYYENFIENIDAALTDIAGISTESSLKYISGIRWNEIKTDTYRNPFTQEIIEVGTSKDDLQQYQDYFDLSRVSSELKSKPLYIHLDMSKSGDKTGIGGVYIMGKRPKVEGQDSSREMFFRVAFNVSVKAPRGYEISFDKNRNFIRWLREQGFNVKGVTSDTYNAAQIQQQLTADRFNVSTLSVDKVDPETKQCLPYAYLRATIYERRIDVYKDCDFLTEEVLGLERESDGHINHPDQGTKGCFVGSTKVSLLDGRELSFLELVDEFNAGHENYVYSFNEETQRIEPKKILNAWKTIENADLVKVTLDNGEEIVCTPNHLFMLRDGSYCEAQHLLQGQSLMPLYRKNPNGSLHNYRMFYEPMEEGWHYEHRRFATEVADEKYLVHHKNCNPADNTPTNLIWVSKEEHQRIHSELSTGSHSAEAIEKRKKSLSNYYLENKDNPVFIERNKKISETLKKRNDTEEARRRKAEAERRHERYLRGKESAELKRLEREQHIKEIEDTFGVVYSELTSKEKNSYGVKLSRLKNPEIQQRISKAVSENHKLGKYDNAHSALQVCNQERHLNGRNEEERLHMSESLLGRSLSQGHKDRLSELALQRMWYNNGEDSIYIYVWDEVPEGYVPGRIKTWKNHKVASVEHLQYKEDVYDITVEDNHNFALSSGVFVHNSKDAIDAICGATYNASKHADEYAYEYGESYEIIQDANPIEEEFDVRKHFENEFMQTILQSRSILGPEGTSISKTGEYSGMDFGFGRAKTLEEMSGGRSIPVVQGGNMLIW